MCLTKLVLHACCGTLHTTALRGAPHLASILEKLMLQIVAPLNTYYFTYLSWKFYLKFYLHTFLIKVFKLSFELCENFNSLFTNKNYFIICNMVRPLWIIAFCSHFCLCIKWDYFVLLNSFFAFPWVFLLGLPSTVLTFLSFHFFWLPLMKWLTICGISECGLIRAHFPPHPGALWKIKPKILALCFTVFLVSETFPIFVF